MKTFFLAGIAILAFGLGTATAGPCTTEIEALSKTLASRDAGSGPTSGASGEASGGSHTAATPSEHPPTAVLGQEMKGKAASPEDVRRQTQGQPTAAEKAETGRAAAESGGMTDASTALERARALDQQGKEAECMASVRQAKQLATPK
jgi:hypothetical protein